jgi:hypothetical protein
MSFSTRFLATTALVAAFAGPALADVSLPAPYVSNALDAVLMPVNNDVRDAFGLALADEGVLVLSVAPGGVAESYGILPGDVLSLDGSSDPVYIDEIVYYWIVSGYYIFDFDIWRDGYWQVYSLEIDESWYWSGVDITTISSWSSWSYESWSYEEYIVTYSEEITSTWEYSETSITETVYSEEFSAEMVEYYGEDAVPEALTEDGPDMDVAEDYAETDTGELADEYVDQENAEDYAADADPGGEEAVDEGGGEEVVDEGGDEDSGA